MVLALRYGSLAGIGAVLLLLGGWFVFNGLGSQREAFPRMFFLGGLLGALGFKHLGYIATVPPALLLAALSSLQFIPDRNADARTPVRRPVSVDDQA